MGSPPRSLAAARQVALRGLPQLLQVLRATVHSSRGDAPARCCSHRRGQQRCTHTAPERRRGSLALPHRSRSWHVDVPGGTGVAARRPAACPRGSPVFARPAATAGSDFGIGHATPVLRRRLMPAAIPVDLSRAELHFVRQRWHRRHVAAEEGWECGRGGPRSQACRGVLTA